MDLTDPKTRLKLVLARQVDDVRYEAERLAELINDSLDDELEALAAPFTWWPAAAPFSEADAERSIRLYRVSGDLYAYDPHTQKWLGPLPSPR